MTNPIRYKKGTNTAHLSRHAACRYQKKPNVLNSKKISPNKKQWKKIVAQCKLSLAVSKINFPQDLSNTQTLFL